MTANAGSRAGAAQKVPVLGRIGNTYDHARSEMRTATEQRLGHSGRTSAAGEHGGRAGAFVVLSACTMTARMHQRPSPVEL